MDINGKKLVNIPHAVSYLLENDEKQDEAISDLDERIRQALAGVFHYKGSVATYANLPATDNKVGDVYNVLETGVNYAWSGTEWDSLAGIVDLSDYMDLISNQVVEGTKSFINGLITKGIDALDQNLNILFGGSTKYQIQENAIYPINSGGASLGTRLLKWLNLCLSGKINPNASGFGLTLPDTSGLTADKEIATTDQISFPIISYADYQALDSAGKQALLDSGCKIIGTINLNAGGGNIVDPILFPRRSYNSYSQGICIGGSGDSLPVIACYEQIHGGTTINVKALFKGVDQNIQTAGYIRPIQDDSNNLGATLYRYKDLFLSGKLSNGTNSVTIADLAALITYAKAQGWIS